MTMSLTPTSNPSQAQSGSGSGFPANASFRFGGGEDTNAQRQRVSIACVYCRQRKIKCNGGTVCNNCAQQGKECTYRGVLPEEALAVRMKKAQQKARRQARMAGQLAAESRGMVAGYPSYDERYNPYGSVSNLGSFSSGGSGGGSRASMSRPSMNSNYPSLYGAPLAAQQAQQQYSMNAAMQGPNNASPSYYNTQSPMQVGSYPAHAGYQNFKVPQGSAYLGTGSQQASAQNFPPFAGQQPQAYTSQILGYGQQQVPQTQPSQSQHSPSGSSNGGGQDPSAYASGLPGQAGNYLPYQQGTLNIGGLPAMRSDFGSGADPIQDSNRPMLPPLGQSGSGGGSVGHEQGSAFDQGGHGGAASSSFDPNFQQGAGSDYGLQPGVARLQSLSTSPHPHQNQYGYLSVSQTASSLSSVEPENSLSTASSSATAGVGSGPANGLNSGSYQFVQSDYAPESIHGGNRLFQKSLGKHNFKLPPVSQYIHSAK